MAGGVAVPYIRKRLETGVPFDWRKVAGKFLAALFGLLMLPSLSSVLAALPDLSWVVAFGMGIAATTVGHEAQKGAALLENG